MPKLPNGITRDHIARAIRRIDAGAQTGFADSTGYDILFEGKRYPPKRVVGLAAEEVSGEAFGPYDFKGGLRSKCFKILESNGFHIVSKGDKDPFPDEVGTEGEQHRTHPEGALKTIIVNKYERDRHARQECIDHYGVECSVCGFDFDSAYGALGDGFIHVHHLVPLSQIQEEYEVDPIADLRPVCPNCHAMLHKRYPPFTIEELKTLLSPNVRTKR